MRLHAPAGFAATHGAGGLPQGSPYFPGQPRLRPPGPKGTDGVAQQRKCPVKYKPPPPPQRRPRERPWWELCPPPPPSTCAAAATLILLAFLGCDTLTLPAPFGYVTHMSSYIISYLLTIRGSYLKSALRFEVFPLGEFEVGAQEDFVDLNFTYQRSGR
jgi:hypothetical protein